jgi:hypothetical protein
MKCYEKDFSTFYFSSEESFIIQTFTKNIDQSISHHLGDKHSDGDTEELIEKEIKWI